MSSTSGWLGMRGTGDWDNDERPTNYRQGILRMSPNGMTSLTGITSMGKSERTDDPQFNWYSKDLATQGGTAAAYSDFALSSAHTTASTAAAGDMVYLKVAEAVANEFRPGHTALVVDSDNQEYDAFGKVTAVNKNGDSSIISVRLKKAITTGDLGYSDYVDIIGSINPEGGEIPDSISYDPTKFTNYTQIWRTPLSITRTQRKTKMRTGDIYQELKREALIYHGVEMEGSILFGEASDGTGDNGQPERTTQGMVPFIRANSPSDNISDFRTAQALTWEQAGEDWFDDYLEVLFRWADGDIMGVVGSGSLRGIQKLVKRSGTFNFTAETGAYGIKVTRWTTPYGDILLKTHPLLSFKPHRRNLGIFFNPKNLRFRYIDDTHFKPWDGQNKAGYQGIDGTKEEYLTEGGFEFHFPKSYLLLDGIGLDPS